MNQPWIIDGAAVTVSTGWAEKHFPPPSHCEHHYSKRKKGKKKRAASEKSCSGRFFLSEKTEVWRIKDFSAQLHRRQRLNCWAIAHADKTVDDLYVCQSGGNIKQLYISLSISRLRYDFLPTIVKDWTREKRKRRKKQPGGNKYPSPAVFQSCWTTQSGSWPRRCTCPRPPWRCWWSAGSRPRSPSVWGESRRWKWLFVTTVITAFALHLRN